MFGVVEMGAAIGLLIQKKDTGGSNAFPFVILSIFFVFLIFAIVIAFYTYREYKCFMMYGQGAMGGMPVPGAPRNNDSINSDPRGDDYYQGKIIIIYIQNLLILLKIIIYSDGKWTKQSKWRLHEQCS